jgi:WD40 repeat protein
VAFSQDGKRITSGSGDQTIRVCDAETEEFVVGPLKGHTHSGNSIGSSLDGEHIVSGSNDRTIRVFSALDNDPPTEFSDSSMLNDGWVFNSSSTLLFWVPPWNRMGLCWPRTSFVIGRGVLSTKLDLDNFVHGDSWVQCNA